MTRIILCLAILIFDSPLAGAERRDYVSGTGNSIGGFSGSYTDPETGDHVTTIIAPRKSEQQEDWPPIYVYPQVVPQWPPTPGPSPGLGPVPSPRSPTTPLPPASDQPMKPNLPSSGGGTAYPVPGGQWQSPFQYNTRR